MLCSQEPEFYRLVLAIHHSNNLMHVEPVLVAALVRDINAEESHAEAGQGSTGAKLPNHGQDFADRTSTHDLLDKVSQPTVDARKYRCIAHCTHCLKTQGLYL